MTQESKEGISRVWGSGGCKGDARCGGWDSGSDRKYRGGEKLPEVNRTRNTGMWSKGLKKNENSYITRNYFTM